MSLPRKNKAGTMTELIPGIYVISGITNVMTIDLIRAETVYNAFFRIILRAVIFFDYIAEIGNVHQMYLNSNI